MLAKDWISVELLEVVVYQKISESKQPLYFIKIEIKTPKIKTSYIAEVYRCKMK